MAPSAKRTSLPEEQVLLRPEDVDRKAALPDQIYELIRMMIVIGQLKPGEPVSEPHIAAQLAVSRTPVREAVKRISDEGLILVRAQNGTFVAELGRGSLEEAYLIRSALEPESAKRAATNATKEHIEQLSDSVDALNTAVQRSRIIEAIRIDHKFHRLIAEISGLHMLWRAVDISKAHMDRSRFMSFPVPGRGQRAVRDHARIVAALKARDSEAAAKAMLEHISASLNTTLSVLERTKAPSDGQGASPKKKKLPAATKQIARRAG